MAKKPTKSQLAKRAEYRATIVQMVVVGEVVTCGGVIVRATGPALETLVGSRVEACRPILKKNGWTIGDIEPANAEARQAHGQGGRP